MVAIVATYTARARRSGDRWAIDVPELPGVFSQARRLDQVEEMARDAISLMIDAAADSFDVVVQPVVLETVAAVASMREDLEELQELMQRVVRVTVHDLKGRGLTVRDIGRILDVSHQRVAQLESRDQHMGDQDRLLQRTAIVARKLKEDAERALAG